MEDPVEMRQQAPLETLWLPWATLFLLYSVVTLISYLLDIASQGLLALAAGPFLPAPLSAAWFGYQATTDVIFTGLLPLSLIWTPSCWPLGHAFCRLDPSLAFLTFWASGRLLTRMAADYSTSLLHPAWALDRRMARQVVFWADGLWILLLGLVGSILRAEGDRAGHSDPLNTTLAGESLKWGQDSWAWDFALDRLLFGLGMPLGVLSALYRIVRMRLQLARVTGRPLLLGLPWATAAMLFFCWFPFHLLLLLRLVGSRKAELQLEDVWVLLRPMGLTLLGSSGYLNPFLYVCVDQTFWRRLGQVLWSCQEAGELEEEMGAPGTRSGC